MTLDNLINRKEAGRILNVNGRTVPRYAKKCLLTKIKKGYKYLYDKKEVELLKNKFEIKDALNDYIKEIYVLRKSNIKHSRIIQEFNIKQILPDSKFNNRSKIEYALDLYNCSRESYLNKFNIRKQDCPKILLVRETMARLKIKDPHVVYDLIENESLKPRITVFNGKEHHFISVDSLNDFLGKYSNKFLYRSHEVSEKTGKSIEEIDRIAHHYHVGFKIKDSKQGNYLFSGKDIRKLKTLNYKNNYKRKFSRPNLA